ncbi:MAG: tRNA (adenosine(37)-N6)-threonylcarbamoyltransferase complex ATPase subunit type 1 TsaE [Ignavibacteria bacterium]|nr:tRNA (adenosine(37)-N6)-threonylcarbamoyltransferase complex ATPase subunit type 1 TsaE [Ignavibacteria bacterium]
MERYNSKSEEETKQIAFEFSKRLKIGDLVALVGELGTGKTLFIRGVGNYFKINEIVTSPSFTIINLYNGLFESKSFNIYHIDLYRIKNINEIIDLGFSEIIASPNSIFFIEWAEKAFDLITPPYYKITFENVEENPDHRIITLELVK